MNPLVLGLIAVVSIYAYFHAEAKEQKINNGFTARACADSTQKVIPTLREILKEKEDPENYLKLAQGLTDRMVYQGRSIPNGQAVRVIDTLKAYPEIVQIHIRRSSPTSVNPRNEYLWIWQGLLCL